MIVVSDSSPLISLVRMSRLSLLADLFGEVHIPVEVWNEVTADPNRAGAKAVAASAWLHVSRSDNPLSGDHPLGDGERGAIALAKKINADFSDRR